MRFVFAESERAEALEIMDGVLLRPDDRRACEHSVGRCCQLVNLLRGVDPGAMQASGVVVGEAGEVDPRPRLHPLHLRPVLPHRLLGCLIRRLFVHGSPPCVVQIVGRGVCAGGLNAPGGEPREARVELDAEPIAAVLLGDQADRAGTEERVEARPPGCQPRRQAQFGRGS